MIWSPRVTVAAVIARDNHYLMVEELVHGKAVINQPAGHLEAGETLTAAVIRETLEETGWGFRPRGIVGIYRWPTEDGATTYLRVAFWGSCQDFDPNRPLDQDIIRTLWIPQEELVNQESKLRSPLVLRAITDFQANRRYPLSLLVELESG